MPQAEKRAHAMCVYPENAKQRHCSHTGSTRHPCVKGYRTPFVSHSIDCFHVRRIGRGARSRSASRRAVATASFTSTSA
eukprot:7378313-Prymnesium_polylepis.2